MPLRLKSLELQGYKTFASRTVFEFAEGITAIVGPNGSGKSNIADALRWVLGEQSYSLLRAKKTDDMIFAGSEHRPRAGMASAAITFDNADNWLPVDFSEVALARRAYRDGHNEYLLNSQHVRLREINELLAQSGLSERTYTILGQGLVDASLALKADERRRLFEEAAGVGLYRARREEALRRLETTSRNLERVLDIMAELEPRLRSLERQARRAQEYAAAQADLRVLLRDWYGYHWHRAQRDLADGRETVRLQEERLREARQAYQAAQAASSAFRGRLQELRARLNGWHRQSAELHNQRETVSRELAVLDERRRSLAAAHQSLLAEQDRTANELRLAQERQEETGGEVDRLRAEVDDAREQLGAAEKSLQARQEERQAVEERQQEARQKVDALTARRAELQARLEQLDGRIASGQQKLNENQLAIQAAEAALQDAEARFLRFGKEHADAVTAAEQAGAALAEIQAHLEERESARREALEKQGKLAAEQSRLTAQLEVLDQADQALTGYAEGARFLLDAARQSKWKGSRGALSAALDVPAELETAVSAALGEQLDAILIESGQDAEQAMRLLEADGAGRAALLPLEWLAAGQPAAAPSDPDCLGRAADLVKAPADLQPALQLLLGATWIVRDRAAARRLVRGAPAQVRAVTLRGEVFRADGTILAGQAPRSGTLARPRQRRELGQALENASDRLKQVEQDLERLTADLAAAQSERDRRANELRQARVALEAAAQAEQGAGLERDTARRQADWQKEQQAALQAEGEQAAHERDESLRGHQDAGQQHAAAVEAVRALTGELAALTLDEVREHVTHWSTRAAVAERAWSDAQARQSERGQAVEKLVAQKEDLAARLAASDQEQAGLETSKDGLRKNEAELHEQLETLRVQIEPAEKELESAEQQEIALQEQEAASQRALTAVERLFAQVQLDNTRRQDALETLRQRIQDDFGLVMFEYASDVSGPVPLPFEGMVEQLPAISELPAGLEEQLTQQRAQLRRMGPINPEAKQEFESERERHDFMRTQVDDLRKAESDLRQVIAELDELTKQEFQKTFTAVDRQFREIFVRLFGGGSARLALTDPENLVETGIEIEARLPGRREQGLALLSGGERSLTAIALVFALLKVSPTPVCVMDEVDAMLDEANVGRFRDLLTELSRDTQFVIITHNRNTVQAADVIYGVTMGRDSASQVISLKLDEISDEMFGRSA